MTKVHPDGHRSLRSKSRFLWFGIVLGLLAYAILRPTPERRFGVALPDVPFASQSGDGQNAGERPADDSAGEPTAEADAGQATLQLGTPMSPGRPPASTRAAPAQGETTVSSKRLGQLTDVDGGVKVSTAGLRYTPGSAEGHRLRHVLRHTSDQPDRPGLHGVFDGAADGALAAIDEAYLLTKRGGPRVKTQRQGPRTVYEVDLARRIGYLGGQVGQRQGHPPASHIRLVLEGDRVITAFPF